MLVARVAGTIADWGRERGYFASMEDGDAFEAEHSRPRNTRFRVAAGGDARKEAHHGADAADDNHDPTEVR